MKKELMLNGTYFMQVGINVVQTTPCGLTHVIERIDLDKIAESLRAQCYDFDWSQDCSTITLKVPTTTN